MDRPYPDSEPEGLHRDDPSYEVPEEELILVCPKCQSPDVGENDEVLAIALGYWVIGETDESEPEFVPEGTTKYGDGEAIEGREAVCRECGWEGPPSELLGPDDPDVKSAELAEAGGGLTEALVQVLELVDGDQAALGEVLYEANKAAANRYAEEQEGR